MREAIADGKNLTKNLKSLLRNKNNAGFVQSACHTIRMIRSFASTGFFRTSVTARQTPKPCVIRLHTEAILDNVLDGIVTIDHTGKVDAYNAAAAKIFGYNKEK
jgi:PAS domain-containing protein